MSVDVSVAADCCGTHSHNFTYNYTPALREAGFPSWSMLDRMPAQAVCVMVGRLITELNSNPHRRSEYGALIRGGGEWGTMETLLESLNALRDDLLRHPDGVVLTR